MWGVITIAVLIAGIGLAVGAFSGGLVLALVVLIVAGAIFPPVALLVGGVALFYLLFVHGQELFGKLNTALGGSKK